MRFRIDAGRQPKECALDAGGARTRDLLGRVEHEECLRRGCGGELLIGLVVSVEDDSLCRNARPLREFELPEGRDVGTEAELAEQSHDRDVRKRLRAIDDQRLRVGAGVRLGL